MERDLRQWLADVENMGELKQIEGADWNLEIAYITKPNIISRKESPALLFDSIKGYPKGYRILLNPLETRSRCALTLNLDKGNSDMELSAALRKKHMEVMGSLDRFAPKVVQTGPVLENVQKGRDVDLFKFPVPKLHDQDGGRYIGTGDVVITRDPDTGEVNMGTYRIMVHDNRTMALYISPGHDGRIHYEKYHAMGKPCPVAVSVGQHPLLFGISSLPFPSGSEYNVAGAFAGEPIKVITDEVTGLPIPANSEIVFTGWCPPDKKKEEGPFGEWTGYYASKVREAPIIEVERVYHRNDPIITSVSNRRVPPIPDWYFSSLFRSTLLHNELVKAGITDIKGVWLSQAGQHMWTVVSIKQRYPGHAKRAALIASQSAISAYMGRYVIVVDDDIDPTNVYDVLWALCTRSDPEKDIDIIRGAWSTPLDPIIRKPTTAYVSSRAIIDACKPYAWIDEFPKEIEHDPKLADKVREKWGNLFS